MRTIVDIGEAELQALDRIAEREQVSRAALVREAVADLLARRQAPAESEAFGLWGEGTVDGLAYQDTMRREW